MGRCLESDEGGVGGEAVALGAVAFDELIAVAVAEGGAEAFAELAVALAVLDVDDEAGGEVGGSACGCVAGDNYTSPGESVIVVDQMCNKH